MLPFGAASEEGFEHTFLSHDYLCPLVFTAAIGEYGCEVLNASACCLVYLLESSDLHGFALSLTQMQKGIQEEQNLDRNTLIPQEACCVTKKCTEATKRRFTAWVSCGLLPWLLLPGAAAVEARGSMAPSKSPLSALGVCCELCPIDMPPKRSEIGSAGPWAIGVPWKLLKGSDMLLLAWGAEGGWTACGVGPPSRSAGSCACADAGFSEENSSPENMPPD